MGASPIPSKGAVPTRRCAASAVFDGAVLEIDIGRALDVDDAGQASYGMAHCEVKQRHGYRTIDIHDRGEARGNRHHRIDVAR